MGVRIGSGLSTEPDARFGAAEAAAAARDALGGRACDLALVFASAPTWPRPRRRSRASTTRSRPAVLVGCGAGGVIGESREVEEGTAVSVWAAALDGGEATAVPRLGRAAGRRRRRAVRLPDLGGAPARSCSPTRSRSPPTPCCASSPAAAPMLPLLGGLASARSPDAETPLLYGDEVVTSGAVGVRLDGVEIAPVRLPGRGADRPGADHHRLRGRVIDELAGRPALEKLRETIEELERRRSRARAGRPADGDRDRRQQARLRAGRLPRARARRRRPRHGPGRGRHADVRPGQVVRLHARDAGSADRDLRGALGARMAALGGRPPAGALLFSCNGRGTGMFGHAHHDAAALDHELGGAPAAGLLRRGRDRPGRRRVLPARLHRHGGGLRR